MIDEEKDMMWVVYEDFEKVGVALLFDIINYDFVIKTLPSKKEAIEYYNEYIKRKEEEDNG